MNLEIVATREILDSYKGNVETDAVNEILRQML